MKSGGPSPVSGHGQTVLLFLTCLVSWDPAESFISSLACRTAWRFFLYFVLSLRLPDSRYAVTLKGSHRCFGKQTCHSMDFGLKGEPLLSVCLLKIPPAPGEATTWGCLWRFGGKSWTFPGEMWIAKPTGEAAAPRAGPPASHGSAAHSSLSSQPGWRSLRPNPCPGLGAARAASLSAARRLDLSL